MSNLTVAPSSSGIWYRDVLADIGAPDTPTNEQALQAWHTSEGTSPNAYNWLATSGTYGQQTNGVIAPNNGYPIHSFSTYDGGVAATAANIKQYPTIVAAFKDGSSLSKIYGAINATAWCKGCQGGNYPSALATLVGNPKIAATVAAQQAGTPIPGACDNQVYLINASPYHFINQCQLRAIMGGALVGIGGLGMFVAVALFVAAGFGKSELAKDASALPGPAGRAAKVARGSAPRRKAAPPRPTRTARADTEELADRRAEDQRRLTSQREARQQAREGFESDRTGARGQPVPPTERRRRARASRAA